MKAVLRFIGGAFLTFWILSILIGQFEESEVENYAYSLEGCEDGFAEINSLGDREHQRSWNLDKSKTILCTSYNSLAGLSRNASTLRTNMRPDNSSYLEYWGSVYRNLVADSRPQLGFLVDSLLIVAQERKLDRTKMAEMVVSFIQDIPYSFVINQPCETYETKGKPCIGNIDLGILSPYEFIHSLYGDCDTRAVLIYALLEAMGYDPMIVVSNEYAHAMLALNIAASGDHIKHRGSNYYFWETTAKGWPIGMLPPSTNNVNYWKIALVNEL